MSDLFLSDDVRKLLRGKRVVLLGCSNIRGIYKDIVWLLNHNSFIPYECLGAKGESRFPDFDNWRKDGKKVSPQLRSIFHDKNRDKLVKFGGLHSGRGYIEPRYYYKEDDDIHIYFLFITRVWSKHLEDWLDNFESNNDGAKIDVLVMSSALWDFNRWGPFGIKEFKDNLNKLIKKLKEVVPESSHFVWLTALPAGKELNSKAMQVPGLEFQCLTSRYNVLESNFFSSHKMAENGFNVIDLHYYSLMQSYRRNRDGIHWSPEANRGFTNLILTYLSLIMEQPLPNRVPENLSLEKIKMMAKVASDEKKDELNVSQKLSELASIAQMMTGKQKQALTELKKIQKSQTFVRGGNRMHPYDNRPRQPRGRGPGRGNGRSVIQNDSSSQPRIWDQSPDPAVIGSFNALMGLNVEPWAPGPASINQWGPRNRMQEHRGSGPRRQRFRQEPGPSDPDPLMQGPFNGNGWGLGPPQQQQMGPEFQSRGGFDPHRNPNVQSGDDGFGWVPGPRSFGGPGPEPAPPPWQRRHDLGSDDQGNWDQNRDSNQWRPGLGFDPVPIGSAMSRLQPPLPERQPLLPQPYQQQQHRSPSPPPDLGRRLNFVPADANFINPMYRHHFANEQGGSSSRPFFSGPNQPSASINPFAEDQDVASFGFGQPNRDNVGFGQPNRPNFDGGNFNDENFRFEDYGIAPRDRLQFNGPQSPSFERDSYALNQGYRF